MNHIQKKFKDGRLLRFCAAFGVLIASTMLSGCFENYGRLRHSNEVTRAFQTDQVEPDYKYYYYGRTNMPYAVVGIDREYQMSSRIWREVDRDTEKFKEMVFWVWDDYRYYNQYNFTKGADILDSDGKKVGIWYSGLWWAAIRFEENKRIVVMPETPFMVDGR
jgi:hypothetical protein